MIELCNTTESDLVQAIYRVAELRAALAELRRWSKPFLTLFGDSDVITRGAEKALQAIVPGAQGQPHELIVGASHFLQEDKGEVVAEKLAAWIAQT